PGAVAGAGRYWRSLAARSCAAAQGPPAGPVHLNLPFREPLVPTGGPPVDSAGRPNGLPWTLSRARPSHPHPDDVLALAHAVDSHVRGVLVAGWGAEVSAEAAARFAKAAAWPILADAISGLRSGRSTISTYDPLARAGKLPAPEIGRASCRERGWGAGVAVAIENRRSEYG